MLGKSLIQYSVEGQGCVPSLLFDLRPKYGGGNDTRFFCVSVPSKSLFSQSCVSSGYSMVELMVTSSKRAYAIPKSATPRAPAPAAGHCLLVPPQETLKYSSGSVSVASLGPGAHKVCLSPPSISGGYGV